MLLDNEPLDDTSKFRLSDHDPIIIKAIGVGGGGNNAVDHMYQQNIKSVSFVNINTDSQTLRHSKVPELLVIGDGSGAGNIPEVARQAAEDSADRIGALFDDDTKMVFITAGMGGGTGTGAAPVVARIARERGLLTIGIVTIPFLFEGQKKIIKALAGADEMSKYVDALLVINNERLTEIYPDCDIVNGFAKADDTLTTAARSISELITCNGHINLDFNDVNTTLREGGAAIISTGYGEGEHRVSKAIEDALNSPLLKNRNILGSKKLLFNLYFSRDADEKFLMEEANELTEFVTGIDEDVDVIWGMAFDDTLGNKVKITILAAGFDVELQEEEAELKMRHAGNRGNLFTSLGSHRVAPERNTKTPARTTVDEERIAAEYGDKADDFVHGKNRSRYIVLTPDQMDDDMVIETLEKTPTLNRDKKIVEKVKNSLGTSRRPDSHDDSESHRRGNIDFIG